MHMPVEKSSASPFHPAAALFPLMDGAEFDELVADIRVNGQAVPVETLSGKVLDGRNRWRACRVAGVEVRAVELGEVADPIAHVVSRNLHRRHLTASQRSMIGAKALALFQARAKARQRGGRGGKLLGANVREAKGRASVAAGKALKVSGRSIDAAAVVLKRGTPEVKAAVDRGDLSVSAASRIARLPAHRQAVALRKAPKSRTPDPYRQLVMWWQRADDDMRRRFREFIEHETTKATESTKGNQ